jgi:hypothetical protein
MTPAPEGTARLLWSTHHVAIIANDRTYTAFAATVSRVRRCFVVFYWYRGLFEQRLTECRGPTTSG